MKLQRRPGTMNRERKALVVFRSTFPDRCSVYTTVYMIPLDAQSSPSLEIRQEEGTNLQIQESILDGYKTKGGGGDGHALLIASFYFFFLSYLKFEHLINGNKNLTLCKLQKSDFGLCNRSFEPLVLDPKYIFNRKYIHSESCQACWHILGRPSAIRTWFVSPAYHYHEHLLAVWATTKTGSTSHLKYLIGLQLRTIQHSPQWFFLKS